MQRRRLSQQLANAIISGKRGTVDIIIIIIIIYMTSGGAGEGGGGGYAAFTLVKEHV